MNQKNLHTDVRLIKLARGIDRPLKWNNSPWITLGHYNWACIEDMTASHAAGNKINLDQIRKHSIEESRQKTEADSYCYSGYIFREFTQAEKEIVNWFWEKESAFMLITRVHSFLYRQTEFEDTLSKRFAPFSVNNKPLSLNVAHLFYRTLDLSDVIIIMKSDSISSLLLELSKLYAEEIVGDIYSYCCINPAEFNLVHKPLAVHDDQIGLTSIRFSVRNAWIFKKILSEMQGCKLSEDISPAFFVTGTDDMNVIIQNASSKTICTLFDFILNYPQEILSLAINDMITRLGMNEDQIKIAKRENIVNPSQELEEKYMQLSSKMLSAIASSTQVKDWHRVLTEIISSLVKMSSSAVFGQLCYILYGTMVGVLHKIKARTYIETEAGEQELTNLLMDISSLIEHIIRMEGELVPHPETRPLLFDIPASILEYNLAFTEACAYYLKNREIGCENADERSYTFFLVSHLCNNITIHDWLNERQDTDRLLYVEIPHALIYNPFEVSCNLAHEVAHHSGEQTRFRKLRLSYMVVCAASIICENLHLNDNDIISKISHKLESCPTALCLNSFNQYLESSNEELQKRIISVYKDQEYIVDLLYSYVKNSHGTFIDNEDIAYQEMVTHYLNSLKLDIKANLIGSFDQIVYLFSECYADIVMISLLGIKIEEYINLFKADYELVQKELCKGNSATYVSLIERTGLVVSVISNDYAEELLTLKNRHIDKNIKDTLLFYEELMGNTKEARRADRFPTPINNMCYHSFYTLDCASNYLALCYEEIKRLAQNSMGDQLHIRTIFNMYARDCRLVTDDFYDELFAFRQGILSDCKYEL